MSDRERLSEAELERNAAFAGQSVDDLRQSPGDRRVWPAAYAADGVCDDECPSDGSSVAETTVDAFYAAVREWASRCDPLTPQAFDDLRSEWALDGPGTTATGRPDSAHVREVSADEIGKWVAETDVAGPVDLDDSVVWSDLHGVPVDGGVCPLVVTLAGDWDGAARDCHRHFHALTRVRDRLDTAGPVRTDGGDREAAVEAFGDVIRFYHEHVDDEIADHTDAGDHPDRPTTAREYFTDVRGWRDETVADRLLGWAPPNHTDRLIAYLYDRGHDREAILSTGVFHETDDGRLFALWEGRYVLPYFDADGRPVYAIARCTGSVGGGAAGYDGHPADGLSGKYAKVAHSDPQVPLSEPIYGADSLDDDTDTVVIAEGIADAISATEAGWGALSPVTTEFKREHIPPLAEIVRQHSVERVVVVPDAEPASFTRPEDADPDPDSIGDALDMPTVSPGRAGALRTADLLDGEVADDGVDVRVAQLPAPASEKVDLDDYLTEWREPLAPVVRSATRAENVRGYEKATDHLRRGDADSGASGPVSRPSETVGGGTTTVDASDVPDDASALWALDVADVTPAGLDRAGDRGKNPVAHKGTSENYFVLRETDSGDLVAADYKGAGQKAQYNALTLLLVSAGERHRDTPEGPLSDAEVFEAWREARTLTYTDDDDPPLAAGDPVPYRALVGVAVRDGVVDEADLVERGDGDDSYRGLPGVEAYNQALAHVRDEYDLAPGREPVDATPRAGGVTFDPRDAWRAVGRVTPSDLDGELELAATDDGDDWVDPHTGQAVDAVRAVAIDAGIATHADERLDDSAWSRAYDRLRRVFDAPVPEYVSREGRAERYDTVIGAVEALTFDHLDTEAFNSEIVRTGDDCRDDVVMNLNPAWRESESGDSVFVYEGGPVYEPEPRVDGTVDVLRFVALDSGLITFADYADTADGELLQGKTFSETYRRARDEYGAPLPRLAWSAPDHTVVLPDAADVSRDAPGDPAEQKRQARQTVAEIVGDAARTPDESTLVTALPGLGKSYAAIKTAAGEEGEPVLYTAGRKELQAQAVDHAGEVGASSFVLPVFGGEATPPATVIDAATEAVHNQPDGQRLLKRRWELREVVEERLGREIPHPDDLVDDDDDAVDLDREVCATAACDADSADELGWWLAVHTARALGFRPAEIHEHATELFGATLPCGGGCDGHDCPYTEAWEAVRDPDNPTDVLIGSPQHAHVTSARTYYERGPNNNTDRSPRAVVVDEYPGDAWDAEFDDEWTRHAAWLASAVADDVPDAEAAVRRADRLWNAPGVRDWLRDDGEAGDPHATLADRLGRLSELVNARETAVWLTDTYESALRDLGVADGVQALADSGDVTAARDALAAFDTRGAGATVVNNLEDVRDALQAATTADGRPLPTAIAETAVEADTVAGPLAEIVQRAVTAAREVDPTDDDAVEQARDTVQAAQTACRGGRRAVELLAVYDDDGRAHPAAGPLLWALLAPSDSEVSTTHEWQNHELAGDDDPVRISAVDMGRTTVLADRAHRFATVRRPPALEAGGGDCPLVGLDATGRAELWETVVGTDMRQRDPHGSAAARREFLRHQGLRVIQTTPEAKTYGGSVDAGSMDGDTAVVEAAADEYAPQVGDDPAVVTTLKAERAAGDRFEAAGADSVDHYGDLKGSNRLGGQRLGVLLGCQHHGHGAVERAAAFAHQDATPTGRGIDQSYGSEVGDAYLRYMWHDTVMQAALRFGRDPEIDETIVVAHTAALRDDLPVVAEGDVVKTYSAGEKRVAEAVADLRGSFTTADVRERLPGDPNPRSVRRQLAALVEAGHLDRTETPNGVANQFSDPEPPGAGQVELPSVGEAHPDEPTQCISYTWAVRVGGGDTGGSRHRPTPHTTLPSPDTAAAAVEGDPPPS